MSRFEEVIIKGGVSENQAEVDAANNLCVKVAPLPIGATSVQQYAAIGGATDKINYTVTTGKNLFIQQWHAAVSEGKGIIFELQDDGTSLASIATGEDGGSGGSMNFPDGNPIGPMAAGSTVRIHRDTGDAGKDWSGGFIGYEEDE